MSSIGDIIDGTGAQIDTKRSGLVYTCNCGWIDLGHARPDAAAKLWESIREEKGLQSGQHWYKVSFGESMSKFGFKDGVSKSFAVAKGLLKEDKESVALAIYLSVSHDFEKLQSTGIYGLMSDSGYSAEDLVSNLIGFYRAVRPGPAYVKNCKPVSKAAALQVWNTYGKVGSYKNPTTSPFLFPCKECSASFTGPVCGTLPSFLSLIQPAIPGKLYKPWDPTLIEQQTATVRSKP